MTLNGTEYFYVRNGQGDITGLIDTAGTQVVSYTYDSWGKLVSIDGTLKDTVGLQNPYRYKGYWYDTETGLYYLQSRYYNPEMGRYINADDAEILLLTQGEILGANLFAYCMNNSIMRTDPTGYYGWWDFYRERRFVSATINFLIAAIVGGSIAAVTSNLKKLAAKQGRYAMKSWLSYEMRGNFARAGLKTAFKAKIIAVVGVAVDFVLTMFDIGGWIFDYIDARDKCPSNKYWDF